MYWFFHKDFIRSFLTYTLYGEFWFDIGTSSCLVILVSLLTVLWFTFKLFEFNSYQGGLFILNLLKFLLISNENLWMR
jgi:hypothetical protein